DHRIWGGPLLAVVDDRLRLEVLHHRLEEGVVAEIADVGSDLLPAHRLPDGHALLQRCDWDQALRAKLVIVAATGHVIDYGHVVTPRRQVHRGRPAEIAVAAKDQ